MSSSSSVPPSLVRSLTSRSRLTAESRQLNDFDLNVPLSNPSRFPSNIVKTAKYTLITFLPVNLFEQFRRLANAYFLLIVLIQTIPNVSPFPLYTSLAPLIFILTLSALNEAREDYNRHQSDRIANSRPTLLVDGGSEIPSVSADLRVGQILKVQEGEEFPADLILLATSREDSTCYANTANLDGEAAPKVRNALQCTLNCRSPAEVNALRGSIQYEKPSTALYRFQGTLTLTSDSGEKETFGLGDKQLLLRGSKLVNTEWIYGLVVYTGAQTKMMLNRNPAKFKFSRFEQQLNQLLIVSLCINLLVCLAPSIYNSAGSMEWSRLYDLADGNSFVGWLLSFITQYILFSFMIPISLYVTIELVKVAQARFIEWDTGMAYKDPDSGEEHRAIVKSSALNEELGHVDCICSDKTGTLTQNRMELSRAAIADRLFFMSLAEAPPGSQSIRDLILAAFSVDSSVSPPRLSDLDESSFEYCARHFLLSILLCNSVLPDYKSDAAGAQHLIFQSQSPDEIALLEAINEHGLALVARSGNNLKVELKTGVAAGASVILNYELLGVLEFSSQWRRMSVAVRELRSEQAEVPVFLYVKGADSTIDPLVSRDPLNASRLQFCLDRATEFASAGSRTLVMAAKQFEREEFTAWYKLYHTAETSLIDRENAIEAAFRAVEKNLYIVGCSAVDDQLQEGVPETLDFLIQAGVRVIMCTGDKLETAVTISRNSGLVGPNVHLIFVAGVSSSESLQSLQRAEQIMEQQLQSDKTSRFALAIDGIALELSLVHHRTLFIAIFRRCETVVCYRSTPMQKAMFVKMCKENLNLTTLAIGDGANDVSMILESHVGIGIYGREGAHAAMSSDFVIYRFHHLKRLLMLHGRWSYWRTAQVIMMSFYKNLAFPIPLFWHQFWALGSGVTMFDALLISTFNTFLTSLPPFFAGFLDKDVAESTLLKYPKAYLFFKRDDCFSLARFRSIIFLAVYHSIILYFFVYGLFSESDLISGDGRSSSLQVMGTLAFTAVVITTNCQMFFGSAWITKLNVFGFAFGICFFALELAVLSNSYSIDLSPDAFDVANYLFKTPVAYLYLIVTISACLVPSLAINMWNRYYHPKMYQLLQKIPIPQEEFQVKRENKEEQDKEKSRTEPSKGKSVQPAKQAGGSASRSQSVSRSASNGTPPLEQPILSNQKLKQHSAEDEGDNGTSQPPQPPQVIEVARQPQIVLVQESTDRYRYDIQKSQQEENQ